MTELAIDARGLRREFGSVRAVDGVDLQVPRGAIFAVLGPNGAGKTTLLRMLATLLAPTGGSAEVVGHDLATQPGAIRERIAMTGQFASLDEDLTGRENLVMLARLWGFSWRQSRQRADALLADFDLSDAATRQVKSYSGGMRRRLDIAASLIVTPELLFLDEPTTGLDPNARAGVWRLIRGLAQSGVTILLTTQYLEEADQLAGRIAVIDHGRKIAEGTSRELKAQTGSGVLHVVPEDSAQAEAAQALLGEGASYSAEGGEIALSVSGADEARAKLDALAAAGIGVAEFSLGAPSLDEVFFALTGKPLPEEETAE
ncbi:ATP-binding cassette domain-containing protein [Pelagovum pacificum]|uniref:ATP-binding cassette domain-containing protein n=1 Tax=Pelagovum pacificum TaxID=2588711 RepID=A0A5C5G9Y3_9RHOB|nr:ATP-binding cassette domain-containing protein [Pelagovum pacificum]QQA42388.1 ATP-binding cassette domain-containing protein [Pelagovum pacificum]TNY31471.1 ATP-binding cassette domain-containing protein [Pelagovum pacificum]